MSLMRRLIGDRRGASAVEFAMIIGPLILLVTGSMEFGRIYWTQEVLNETAAAGSRCMGLPESGCRAGAAYDAAATRSFVTSFAAGRGITLTPTDIAVNRAASCRGLAGFSEVRLTYSFETPLPLLDVLMDGMTLTSVACFPNQPV